jgi:protein-S-isoprenylcysteine O-methyltransferase Ste14
MMAAAVRPLIYSNSTAQWIAGGSFAVAWVLELAHTFKVRGHLFADTDRGTLRIFSLTTGGAIFIAVRSTHWAPGLTLADGGVWPLIAGLALFWSGFALRWWAIVTLGHFFQVTVVIQEDHRVVTDGPYRLMRHPGYAGLWVALVGIGFVFGNLLGVCACVFLPLIALFLRIRVEEQLLEQELGDEYRTYEATTKRLIPGVW